MDIVDGDVFAYCMASLMEIKQRVYQLETAVRVVAEAHMEVRSSNEDDAMYQVKIAEREKILDSMVRVLQES